MFSQRLARILPEYAVLLTQRSSMIAQRASLHRSSTACMKMKGIPAYEVEDDRDRIVGHEASSGVNIKDVVLAAETFQDADKDKESFIQKVDDFSHTMTKHRTGQVEFIYGALRLMKEFNVHKDLDAYKALMDVFPKDRMQPANWFQAGMWHFWKQQNCAVTILDEMEYHGLTPDQEMEALVISIFSKISSPWRKVARQLYWRSKLMNANPYPLPEELPNDAIELAKLALRRMCPDLQTKIGVFATGQIIESIDKTWIVSAQSPAQQELIAEMDTVKPVYIEGNYRVWLDDKQISYYVLRADTPLEFFPDEDDTTEDPLDVSRIPINVYGKSQKKAVMAQRDLHRQRDGTVLAICATGTSSRDSLLSWIRSLEASNPNLANLQVIFTLKAPSKSLAVNEPPSTQSEEDTKSRTYSESTN